MSHSHRAPQPVWMAYLRIVLICLSSLALIFVMLAADPAPPHLGSGRPAQAQETHPALPPTQVAPAPPQRWAPQVVPQPHVVFVPASVGRTSSNRPVPVPTPQAVPTWAPVPDATPSAEPSTAEPTPEPTDPEQPPVKAHKDCPHAPHPPPCGKKFDGR